MPEYIIIGLYSIHQLAVLIRIVSAMPMSTARGSRGRRTNPSSKFDAFAAASVKSRSIQLKALESEEEDENSLAESIDQVKQEGTVYQSKFRVKKKHFWRAVWGKGLGHSIAQCLKTLPYNLWKCYIESFLIPKYRPEWGRYIKWDSQVAPLTAEQRARKKRELYKKSRTTQKTFKSSRFRKSNAASKKKTKHKKKRHLIDRPPHPVPHNHSDCVLVRINVSGQIFEPQLRTLKQFPNTLLGDPRRIVQFYDPDRNEFFFDRHRSSFEAILYYYNTGGILRCPSNVSFEIFLEEVKFYDLGPEVLGGFQTNEGSTEDVLHLPKNLLQRKLWLLFDYPESSHQSRIVAYISILAVCMSIFEFCIETLPEFSIHEDHQITSSEQLSLEHGKDDDTLSMKDPFFFTETVCIIFFVLEYIMRAATCPHFFNFVKEISNLIDLVAVMPYFLNVVYFVDDAIAETQDHGKQGHPENKAISLTIFRIIRLVRVFRILKLSRHNRGLKILGKTLKASSRELGLLVFFLMVGVVVFSSAMFFAETQYPNSPFTSIPAGFWFGVVTMTTLGYGDMVPLGPYGKIIGALCAIAGVLAISLPVPVVVSNFNMFYNSEEMNTTQNATAAKVLPEYKHVDHCPYYPAWYTKDGQVAGDEVQNPAKKSSADSSESVRWLMGEQKPDYSDSDFEVLLNDKNVSRVSKKNSNKVNKKSSKNSKNQSSNTRSEMTNKSASKTTNGGGKQLNKKIAKK